MRHRRGPQGVCRRVHAPEQPDSITNAAKPLEPWHGHELRFIHCCGLLFNRMLAVNPIPFGDVCRTSAYGLSEPKRYVQAMQLDGDGEGGTLREILDRGPGDVLKARWCADIFNWYRLSPKTDAHTAAAEKAQAFAEPGLVLDPTIHVPATWPALCSFTLYDRSD